MSGQARPPVDKSAHGSTYSQPQSANSSFGSLSGETPPSAVSDSSFFPDEYFHLVEDTSPGTWPLDIAQWHGTQVASTTSAAPFRPMVVEGWTGIATGPPPKGNPPMIGATNVVSSHADNSPRPRLSHPILPHTVDASQYQNIPDEEWMLSIVDYDSAPSPASLDSHSTEPRTPVSTIDGEQFGVTCSRTNTHSSLGVPHKVEAGSSFPSNGSAASWPGSFCGDYPLNPTFAAACFGGLTNPGRLGQASSGWPLPVVSTIPPSMAIDGSAAHHTHGLPLFANPSPPRETVGVAPPQVAQPATSTTLLELEPTQWETSPEACGSEDGATSDGSDQAVAEARLRRDRDKYLLKMRERGVSYKEIKRRGKFREAESTLRGRIRALTKHKSERVRRPDWTAEDVNLLERAVDHFDRCDGPAGAYGRDIHTRVPWKKISEWMRSQGSSYTFAPATCAKKYRELRSL